MLALALATGCGDDDEGGNSNNNNNNGSNKTCSYIECKADSDCDSVLYKGCDTTTSKCVTCKTDKDCDSMLYRVLEIGSPGGGVLVAVGASVGGGHGPIVSREAAVSATIGSGRPYEP